MHQQLAYPEQDNENGSIRRRGNFCRISSHERAAKKRKIETAPRKLKLSSINSRGDLMPLVSARCLSEGVDATQTSKNDKVTMTLRLQGAAVCSMALDASTGTTFPNVGPPQALMEAMKSAKANEKRSATVHESTTSQIAGVIDQNFANGDNFETPKEESKNGRTTNKEHREPVIEHRRPTSTSPTNKRATHDFLESLIAKMKLRPITDAGSSLEEGYFQQPTERQMAAFGHSLVKAVHRGDVATLRNLLNGGLCPNPCNRFGDSVLTLVCKRGDYEIFQCFVDHGCNLSVCDSWGRTPLHHVAYSGRFSSDIVRVILEHDIRQLFLRDQQGKCPLEYVRPEHSQKWCNFLESELQTLWPSS